MLTLLVLVMQLIGECIATCRSILLEFIEQLNIIKMWIQLNIPRIEDGNNFGVSIQVCLVQFT